jgi:predicted DNA-binding protein
MPKASSNRKYQIKESEMSARPAIKISERLLKKFDKIAKETSKPLPVHIRRALEEYVEEYEDCKIAKARSEDPNETFLTSKEFWKLLGL